MSSRRDATDFAAGLSTRDAHHCWFALTQGRLPSTLADSGLTPGCLDELAPDGKGALRAFLDGALSSGVRAARPHESWTRAILNHFPESLHPSIHPFLVKGPGLGMAQLGAAIVAAIQAAIPIGPVHCPTPRVHTPPLVAACLLPYSALSSWLEDVGLTALELASGGSQRQLAALTSQLPEEQGRIVALARKSGRISSDEYGDRHPSRTSTAQSALVSRLQATFLQSRQRSGGREAISDLANLLLGAAAGPRYDRDLHFLSFRMPQPIGRRLLRVRERAARWPLEHVDFARSHLPEVPLDGFRG